MEYRGLRVWRWLEIEQKGKRERESERERERTSETRLIVTPRSPHQGFQSCTDTEQEGWKGEDELKSTGGVDKESDDRLGG
jgi:hypothetical protein